MSREASLRLKLVARLDSVSIDLDTVKIAYPKLCDGLGWVQKPYTIKLRPDAKPFWLQVPRKGSTASIGQSKNRARQDGESRDY